MLDPWTALSLAAAIVQFIDFSSKIVFDAKEIQKDGKSLRVLAIGDKATRLISLCETIRRQQLPKSVVIGLTDAEQVSALQDFYSSKEYIDRAFS
jgi:hypothetical protein